MDIKSAPTIPVVSQPTVNPNPAFSGTNALPQFLVRTMKRDLSAAGGTTELKISPLPSEKKTTKEEDQTASAEKTRRKKELAQIFEIAKLQTEKGVFEKEEDLKKILTAPEAGWWLKWKTRSLLEDINKAKGRKKPVAITPAVSIKTPLPQIKPEIKPIEKPSIDSFRPTIVSPPSPKITAAPPPELPIAKEIPVPEPKPEIKAPAPRPVAPAPEILKPAVEPAKLAKPIIPPALQARKIAPPPIAPIAPPKPLIPVKLSPETKPTPKKAFSAKFVFGALVFVLLFAVGGLIYFNLSKQPKGTPTPTFSATPLATETPSPSPGISSAPLFEMEGKIILKINDEGKNLFTLIQNSEIENKTAGSFTQIILENDQEKMMDFEEIASLSFAKLLAFEDVSSSSLKSLIDPKNFSFFAFWEKQNNFSPFEPSQNQPKIGLAIKLAQASSKTELEKIFKEYEPDLPALLKNLLPESAKTESQASFAQNNDRQTVLHYFNFFPDASLSIDYALTDNYLLIATSRQSAYSALEKLLSEKTGPALR